MHPARKQELISMMHRARSDFTRLPGPSDDPDAQTASASAFRHVLVMIQMLATPILPSTVGRRLEALSIDTSSIHDVYEVLPKLNALLFDIDEALEGLDDRQAALTRAEVNRLVNHWIGVEGG